tara:strand:- start:720 stop:1121 length:402 start_codon:yes stop_codon:yes gene_type:complete
MDLTDYVCYKKNNKIYSLGVEINSSLANDMNCLNYSKEKSNTNNNSNKLFRTNLGIPLPLYLIQNERKNLENFFKDDDTEEKTQPREYKCVGETLFDNLFELQKHTRKIPKTRKKRKRNKGNKKTRKNSIFNF